MIFGIGVDVLESSRIAQTLERFGARFIEHLLMPEEHDPRRDGGVDFRPAAADHMGHIMEVTGTEASHAGYRAIFVTGFTKK